MRLTPYAPRPVRFLGLHLERGFRLKTYSIVHPSAPWVRERFQSGFALALQELPQPALRPDRPGLGFVILHQGRTGDYVVLCWWDRENELPIRVFVRDPEGWRAARGSESVCVWDLEVIGHERDAYVAALLGGDAAPEAYLERVHASPGTGR